ncbi:MAG: FliA/WhiG family RNA polymerase sigma factor [Candidatus Hydrogenedentes bacterium]|nr:FliA/WhiG family RNA polymerase sigma factor [Candidatus Hydrogenedentota bacterium]MBI3118854.1 FliA/WhiG family RNA polymerase sigma factor [Candidatus Hydrogenedentota bacterium]
MTAENEKELWIRCKEQGDSAAREALILHHMRIVRYVAGRMAIHVPSSIEMNDLVGWGVMGLLDAVEKFDHRQDIKFTTYATIRIRGAIIDQIRSLDWAPRSLRTMARRVGEARETLRQRRGLEPDSEAIAEQLGTTADHVDDTMAQMQTAHVLSLDTYLPSEEEEETRKIDVTSNALAPSPLHLAIAKEKQELVVQAILQLPDQQQKVLNLYYYEELTLKEIGLVLNVSESRICQIHTAAMKNLRKFVRERE